jgi:phenylacetic acid degradation operon negative regulatory protein
MPQNTPSPVPDLEPLLQAFPLRTWSMIVTIMGDLLASPQDRISGRALAHLTGRMGISDQALRVAIHRLKKDGWIDAQRAGRGSSYFLTQSAWQRTEQARPRIYGATAPDPGPAYLLVLGPDDPIPADGITLAPRCILQTGHPPADRARLALPLAQAALPDWVQDQVLGPEIREELTRLEQMARQLAHRPPAQGVDAWAARLILLHHWRRSVLRLPDLAEALGPKDGPAARCRRAVIGLLETCPAPSISALTASLG